VEQRDVEGGFVLTLLAAIGLGIIVEIIMNPGATLDAWNEGYDSYQGQP